MHPPNASLRRHEQFHSAFLPDDRDVLVWLPPGYDEINPREDPPLGTPVRNPREESSSGTLVRNRRYPVLYMHDGQNLFDPDTAFQKGQHWRVGETAGELITAGAIEPLIVVGIHNTGTTRIEEYTPTADARLGGGLADEYGRLIVEELKPFIDNTYRTLSETSQHRPRRLVARRPRHASPWLQVPARVRPPGRALAIGVVGSPRDPADGSQHPSEAAAQDLGRHGHRRRPPRPGRCEAAEGGAGRGGVCRRT